MPPLSTREIATLVGGELRGDAHIPIEDVATIAEAGPHDLVFVESRDSLKELRNVTAGAALISQPLFEVATQEQAMAFIVVEEPMAAFITVMLHFRPLPASPSIGISQAAFVSETAQFGKDCQVFPGATVGDDVRCGDGCVIHSGARIGDGCRLGDGVVVHPNAVLYPHITIRDRVIIHATAVIGADGFGYRFADGRFHKIPHAGSVLIENDVEIGAGTTIDRAMIGTTVIGEGTKLDNQVMIAHNCRIGRHNAFASQVGLAGSTTSGDYVRCGGQAGIADHSHLGTGSSIGAKAGLFGVVPDGADYHGYPAGPAKEQYRIVMTMQKLPEMRKQLRELASEMTRLQQQVASLSSSSDPGTQLPRPAAA